MVVEGQHTFPKNIEVILSKTSTRCDLLVMASCHITTLSPDRYVREKIFQHEINLRFAGNDRAESPLYESIWISRIGSQMPELSVNKYSNFWPKFWNRLYDDNITSWSPWQHQGDLIRRAFSYIGLRKYGRNHDKMQDFSWKFKKLNTVVIQKLTKWLLLARRLSMCRYGSEKLFTIVNYWISSNMNSFIDFIIIFTSHEYIFHFDFLFFANIADDRIFRGRFMTSSNIPTPDMRFREWEKCLI